MKIVFKKGKPLVVMTEREMDQLLNNLFHIFPICQVRSDII